MNFPARSIFVVPDLDQADLGRFGESLGIALDMVRKSKGKFNFVIDTGRASPEVQTIVENAAESVFGKLPRDTWRPQLFNALRAGEGPGTYFNFAFGPNKDATFHDVALKLSQRQDECTVLFAASAEEILARIKQKDADTLPHFRFTVSQSGSTSAGGQIYTLEFSTSNDHLRRMLSNFGELIAGGGEPADGTRPPRWSHMTGRPKGPPAKLD